MRSEGGNADTLQSLCLVNKANLTAVKALMHGMDNMLRSMGSSDTGASGTHDGHFQDLITSCSYHGGFLSEPATTVAIAEKLNAEYQQLCQGITDMDERPFLAKAAEAPSTPKPAAPPSLSRCVVGSPQRYCTMLMLPLCSCKCVLIGELLPVICIMQLVLCLCILQSDNIVSKFGTCRIVAVAGSLLLSCQLRSWPITTAATPFVCHAAW